MGAFEEAYHHRVEREVESSDARILLEKLREFTQGLVALVEGPIAAMLEQVGTDHDDEDARIQEMNQGQQEVLLTIAALPDLDAVTYDVNTDDIRCRYCRVVVSKKGSSAMGASLARLSQAPHPIHCLWRRAKVAVKGHHS